MRNSSYEYLFVGFLSILGLPFDFSALTVSSIVRVTNFSFPKVLGLELVSLFSLDFGPNLESHAPSYGF